MKVNAFRSLWLLAGIAAAPTFACEPLGYDKGELLDPASADFSLPEEADVDAMVLALADCLGDPDPEWRDRIGYMGIMTLLRGVDVDTETVHGLMSKLVLMLDEDDESGFLHPFVILALAEVARVDRLDPFLLAGERAALVFLATDYVSSVRDYRGYIPGEGWRHGVAHGADFLLQLVLNPELNDTEVRSIVEAALSQVVASDDHFYIFGESARLARPVLFAARRDVIPAGDWAIMFDVQLVAPPGFSWSTEFSTLSGQSRLHNAKAFLLVIYSSVAESDNEVYAGIRDAARSALGKLP